MLGDIHLLDGEKVMSVAKDVTYLCPYNGPSRGVLKVTNYQLHFRPTDSSTLQGTLSVPLGVVSLLYLHTYYGLFGEIITCTIFYVFLCYIFTFSDLDFKHLNLGQLKITISIQQFCNHLQFSSSLCLIYLP